MTYIDCYLVPVPNENRAAYEELARISVEVAMEAGALRVIECWLDESGPQASTYHDRDIQVPSEDYGTFRQAAGARAGETVVMSYVEWPSKVARDAGMNQVTGDPRMKFEDLPPTFEGSRLIAGGFMPMLDVSAETGS